MVGGLLAVMLAGALVNAVEAAPDGGCRRTTCYPQYERGYSYGGECGGYTGCGYGGYGRYDRYGGYDGYRGYRGYGGYGYGAYEGYGYGRYDGYGDDGR